MDNLSALLARILTAVYPSVTMDAQGLANILLPCLIIAVIGLVITLIMKILPGVRRYTYVALAVVFIALITASSFFPVTLAHAGQFAAGQIQEQIAK